ncbi:unnamed protein product, partial [Staurois parvus]
MRHSGPGSSKERRAVTAAHGRLRAGSSNGRPVICQHPMTKWNPTSSVRRPESGTMAEFSGDGDSSNGSRTGTHDDTLDLAVQH